MPEISPGQLSLWEDDREWVLAECENIEAAYNKVRFIQAVGGKAWVEATDTGYTVMGELPSSF